MGQFRSELHQLVTAYVASNLEFKRIVPSFQEENTVCLEGVRGMQCYYSNPCGVLKIKYFEKDEKKNLYVPGPIEVGISLRDKDAALDPEVDDRVYISLMKLNKDLGFQVVTDFSYDCDGIDSWIYSTQGQFITRFNTRIWTAERIQSFTSENLRLLTREKALAR